MLLNVFLKFLLLDCDEMLESVSNDKFTRSHAVNLVDDKLTLSTGLASNV